MDYLYRGLCGLARAHRAGGMAGHVGASLIAGQFFCQEHPELDPRVHAAVRAELDRIAAGEETVWFNQKKVGMTVSELVAPLPVRDLQKDAAATLAEALRRNIGKLRQSGHNVIFAALAVKALQAHPDHAAAGIVDGIRKLVACFDNAGPGRGYYGEERGWLIGADVPEPTGDVPPPYGSARDMAAAVLDAVGLHAGENRRGFGGLFHVINHAAALNDLLTAGYGGLAEEGLTAHRDHLRVWRELPVLDSELGRLEAATRDPHTPAYWQRRTSSQWSGWLTHRVKTLYGFARLLALVDDVDTRGRAESGFRFLMA